MKVGRPLLLNDAAVRGLRSWRALPRSERPETLAQAAKRLRVSYATAKNATYGMRGYARMQP